jgi:hypothetical protein
MKTAGRSGDTGHRKTACRHYNGQGISVITGKAVRTDETVNNNTITMALTRAEQG